MALAFSAALASAEQACAAGDCLRAIGLVEEALRRQPSDFRLLYRLGICYGGACRRHPLVHPEMALSYLRQALPLTAEGNVPRAAVLDAVSVTLLTAGSNRQEALRMAISCESEAAGIYLKLDRSEEWARAQFNLGNSCSELSEIAGEDHWQAAIGHYQQALQVRTRDRNPERYAATLENLGAAYRHLPLPQRAGGIRQAIDCYRRALAIYTRLRYPQKHASLHNNLGNVFLMLAEGAPAVIERNARRALRHFDRALRIQSCEPLSRAFGITQYNRAQACLLLGDPAMAACCLEAAAAAFDACPEERYALLIRRLLERSCRGVEVPTSPAA